MNKKLIIFLLLCPLFAIGMQFETDELSSKSSSQVLKDLTSYACDNVALWKAFLKNPSAVSALTVSSPWLVREIISPITEYQKNKPECISSEECGTGLHPKKPLRILEVGFGPGTVTRTLIETLEDEDHLDAIELMESMYQTAKKDLPEKKNVHLHCANFATWLPDKVTSLDTIPQECKYDFIVTTLPFTQLPENILVPILERIQTFLKPQGTFTYIALVGSETVSSWFSWGKKNQEYLQKMALFSEWKKEYFYSSDDENSAHYRHEIVYFNMPPNRVTHLQKK